MMNVAPFVSDALQPGRASKGQCLKASLTGVIREPDTISQPPIKKCNLEGSIGRIFRTQCAGAEHRSEIQVDPEAWERLKAEEMVRDIRIMERNLYLSARMHC